MAKVEYDEGTITIKGKEIPVKTTMFSQSNLHYYSENPRIYSAMHSYDSSPSQQEIEETLGKMDHVKILIQSIVSNEGLIDPLIVRDGDNVVLEGNSRLAAYRLLAQKDPIKWGKVKCSFLPKDIKEELVFSLLGEYHIIGKKDWSPYEQAGYLWRRKSQHDISPAKMAKELGLSNKAINHLINVYSFMIEHDDTDPQRWSYYDEYLKCRKIGKRREEYPDFDKIFVDKIHRGEISKAVEVRDKVKKIAQVGGKTFNKFLSKSDSLDSCYESAIMRGAGNTLYNQLAKFRFRIADPDVKNELKRMTDVHYNKCMYELKQIKRAVDNLLSMGKRL
jgi:hypothetical protein